MGNKFSKKENKLMARLLALVLCAVLLCGLGVTAFAANVEDGGESKEEIVEEVVEEIVEEPEEEVGEEIVGEPEEEVVESDNTEAKGPWTVKFVVGDEAKSAGVTVPAVLVNGVEAEVDENDSLKVDDGAVVVMPALSWEGKVLIGWSSAENNIASLEPGKDFTVNNDVEFKAIWTAAAPVSASDNTSGIANAKSGLSGINLQAVGAARPSSGNELDQSYWNKDALVYWDTITAKYSGSTVTGATSKHADASKIASVVLNGFTVKNSNSGSTSASGGTSLQSCFPGATTKNEVTGISLVITPASGYYVSAVVVACTGTRGQDLPVSCRTFNEGNAFTAAFGVSASGSTTITVSSKDFAHASKSNKYFILIEVKPIPTPLYVAYEYGEASTILGGVANTPFADHASWLATGSGNVYKPSGDTSSNGREVTKHTLYKYTYPSGNSTGSTQWRHFANSVTDAAKAAMEEKGYYFAGWKAEYYTASLTGTESTDVTCSTSNIYTFRNQAAYGEGSYNEGDQVNLVTNVKMIAQWLPIELKLTKTVSGLEGSYANDRHEYTLQLEKLIDGEWVESCSPVILSVQGNGSVSSDPISPVLPGTYRVKETEGNTDISKDSEQNAMYITVDEGGECIVNCTNHNAELVVKNSYSPKPRTTDVTVKKVVTGNLGDWNKAFSFSVLCNKTLGTPAEGAGYTINNNAAEFSLKHNDSIIITGVEIGSVLQLEEVNEDYTITSVKVGDTTLEPKTGEAGNTYYEFAVSSETPISVEVTNWKDEQPETGISLDSLPYILILVGVGAAGVVMFLKKRRDAYDA